MKKYRCLILFLITIVVSGCTPWLANYGKIKYLAGDRKKNVTINTLIENWEDYDIYYAGLGVKLPLGIMFDPKDNNTKLTGDRWQKVADQKTLIEITRWIYPTTLEFPWLAELLGPKGRFLGYLYYAGGPAALKKIDDATFYMFDLENPDDSKDSGIGDF